MYTQEQSHRTNQQSRRRAEAVIVIPVTDLDLGEVTLDAIVSNPEVLSLRRQRWNMSAAAPAPETVEPAPRLARWRAIGLALLMASTLLGAVAVLSALGVWSGLNAANLGLDERGAFCLLAGGAYLLIAVTYSAWRTRLLHDMESVPWDVRLMACFSLVVGGLVSITLGVILLAILAVVMVLVGLVALSTRSQD